MEPTDTGHPDYFHKVVDCQWACPAHTDVPEYIRLIAQARFTDAYLVNRESNVYAKGVAADDGDVVGQVIHDAGHPAGAKLTQSAQPWLRRRHLRGDQPVHHLERGKKPPTARNQVHNLASRHPLGGAILQPGRAPRGIATPFAGCSIHFQ